MAQDTWVTRESAAYEAGVTEDVVKSWVYRGWLDANGERRKVRTKDGRVLIGDVRDAERDTASKRARSHRRLDPPRLDEYAA